MTWHYYDLLAGVELRASNLTLHVEKDGYGGLLATPNTTADDPELAALLSKMAAFNAKPIASFDPTWHFELGGMVKQPPAPQQASAAPQLKMAKIPGGKYRFVVQGVEIEGGGSNYNDIGKGVDVQHSWEPRPNRFHSQCDSFLSAAVVLNTNGEITAAKGLKDLLCALRYVWVTPYLIDLAPVTQAEFAAYLAKEGPKALPTDRYHYLKNWDWSGEAPKPGAGNGSLPVSTTIIGDILDALLPTSF